MGHLVRELKGIFPIILIFGLGYFCTSVDAVAAASEWPLGIPDEYTTAWINITYRGRNGSLVTERSQSGRFGKGSRIASVSGVVVHVRSHHNGTALTNHFGCEPIINEVPQENWIALIKRGLCDFNVKLDNAFAKKAVGMVVYDKEDSDALQDMKLSAYTIPGIFTFKSRGERIANLSDSGMRVEMHITVGEVCSRPYTGINRTSVLFVSISFIVLMIISLAWLVFYYVQRFRYLHAKDRLAQRLCNAAKKALAKIPTRSIKQSDKEMSGEGECCAVCIEFYKPGDMLRTLPCRHEFHKCCVDPWLLEHRTCPMCKMDILKYYGFIFTGSQESILHLDLEDGAVNSSDSRETDSPSQENQVSSSVNHSTTHQHWSQQLDSVSVSSPTDDGESGTTSTLPPSQNGTKPGGARKLSLIALEKSNEIETSPTESTSDPPPAAPPSSAVISSTETSDSFNMALSENESGEGSPGHMCNSPRVVPMSSETSPALSPTSLPSPQENEDAMCQYKNQRNGEVDPSNCRCPLSGTTSTVQSPQDSSSNQPSFLRSPQSFPASPTSNVTNSSLKYELSSIPEQHAGYNQEDVDSGENQMNESTTTSIAADGFSSILQFPASQSSEQDNAPQF